MDKTETKEMEGVEPILIQAGDKRVLLNGFPPILPIRVVAEAKYQEIISKLQKAKELNGETSIPDKNGIIIREGDRVKERQQDFAEELGYIDVFYRVEWSRWCYGLFIHDKWIKPLDTITARALEVVESLIKKSNP